MMKRIVLGACVAATLSSCLKEELPVPARERGSGMHMQACMGPGYEEQLWIDVRTGTVVSTNVKTAWDLAFESSADGWHIYLNGSKLMTAWNKGAVDIAAPHDTVGMFANKRIDAPSGLRDSTAIGDWRGNNEVYVIDRGYNGLGQSQGLRKFRFLAVNATSFTFEVAAMDGSQHNTVTIPKDPTRAFTCYKVEDGVVDIEPAIGSWDLVLTQYTHQFHEPFLPYIVTGMLSASTTRTAIIRNADFQAVSLDDTLAYPMSGARDVIGYDWKDYSFETSSYTVDQTLVYIVRDAEGYFYKLRFIDFYSSQGQVGCPLFEVVPL